MDQKPKKKISHFALVVISLLGIVYCFFSCAYAAYKGIKPLVVLVEEDPWLMVVGSDSPTFVLYDNGLLIYFDNGKKEYRSVKLSAKELSDLSKSLLKPKDLDGLADAYEFSDSTDQPTDVLFLRYNNKVKKIYAYGGLRFKDVRAKAPVALVAVFDNIISYHNNLSKTWLPDKIEIMIWPYYYAPDGVLQWPKNWPDINSSDTKKRRDAYSIFIDSSLVEEYKVFLSKLKEKQAVLMNNKKWAISDRYPFPGEEEWMKQRGGGEE